jgi:hypothetical protein
MFDFIFAPVRAVGEFIMWGLILYGVVNMAQLIGFIIRGYYMMKFMKNAADLVANLAREVAELRRELPREIANAERRLAARPVPPPLPPLPPVGVPVRDREEARR